MATLPSPLFLIEIAAYGAPKVLRYASGQGFTTQPSESPASEPYDARVKQPIDINRSAFSGSSTMGRSTVGVGDLILDNADGALDALVGYGFDGQSVVVRWTTTANPSYPADFSSYTLTATGAEFTSTEVRISLRDRQQLLDVPLQTTKYAGTNALPSGLEGVADFKGKSKPVCYGVVKNAPVPCVNTSKLIYQVNDGAIASVDAVYDRGLPLTPGYGWTVTSTLFGGTIMNLWSVHFGNAVYVTVGDKFGAAGGFVATSPDGATWTQRSLPGTAYALYDGVYANSKHVIVGGSPGTKGQIFTSSDGITWTEQTSSFGTDPVHCVTWSSTLSLFVAGGENGKIATSPDGVTWTQRATGLAAGVTVNDICVGNGLIVSTAGVGQIVTSLDGVTWTSRIAAFSKAYFSKLAYSSTLKRFLATGYDSVSFVGGAGTVATSDDGITWIRGDGFLGTDYPGGLVFADGLFTAVGTNGSLATSPDGSTWTVLSGSSSPVGTSFSGMALTWNSSRYVAVGIGSGTTAIAAYATPSNYASLADLQDDTKAPAAGTFKYYAAGGYFRLGYKPDGLITADVTQGATAADRTHAQIWKNIALRCPSLSSSDLSASDITALDAAQPAVAGIWFGPDDDSSCADGADRVAQSCGAWWSTDRSGVFRLKQLTAPSGTAALSLTPNDFKRPLERITPGDATRGIPTSKVTLRYARYYQTLTTDLAAGVDDASRAAFAQEWRDTTDSDSSVLTAHPLSVPLVIESLFAAASDAATEATRVLTLRKVQRGMYEAVVQLTTETIAIDLGAVVSITQPRYGMSAGVLFRVLDVRPDAKSNAVTWTLWGGS